jgi:hypothetical protein
MPSPLHESITSLLVKNIGWVSKGLPSALDERITIQTGLDYKEFEGT